MCSVVLLCVCVIYNIIKICDWFNVIIYLKSVCILLVFVDNWENFLCGFEGSGDFIYVWFWIFILILIGFFLVYYKSFFLFC